MTFENLSYEQDGAVTVLTLQRAEKRNAINDALLHELDVFFSAVPEGTGAVVLQGAGEHFCAGLDLAERLSRPKRSPFEGVRHSRLWHQVFERIQFGEVPVICVLKGGVIGGGLELATSTHVRVAESSAFFQLPEGQRGIFVGGGGSVRVPRIIGVGRMVEMMLTGRRYSAEEGERLGLAHYLVPPGAGLEHAMALAQKVASNAALSNFAVIQGIARINDMSISDGLFTEAMVGALTRAGGDADQRIQSFFESRKSAPTAE
jgi:enoyl-CoA hydratase/carnithine racemase